MDGFAASTSGGGWYGSNRLIYHKWMWNEYGGTFAGYATDGLTHEFAHSRGATDIYGMKVDVTKNPINGKAFDAINSIMNYPYGNITWDEHTVNLLNRTGPGKIIGEEYITAAFPKKIAVRVRDSWGDPLPRAVVQTYPVDWFSYRVTPQPIERELTDDRGEYVYPSNPFGPSTSTSPWAIRYPNFLVRGDLLFGSITNGYPCTKSKIPFSNMARTPPITWILYCHLVRLVFRFGAPPKL